MSQITKILAFGAFFLSSVAFAKVDFSEIRAAQQQVTDYRELRRTCTNLSLAEKQKCYNRLSSMTEEYKKAKRFLAVHKSTNENFLSFAE